MAAYTPNDASIIVDDLEFLRTARGQALLHEATDLFTRSTTPAVGDIARLRRNYPAPAVHAALAMAQLQAKAQEKFPELACPHAPFIYALPEALEQATDTAIAGHKAARFGQAGATHILDLCCGIGGDTRALADVAPVTAIDLSAPRLACLKYNLESNPPTHPVETQHADVTTVSLSHDALFHIDPARRSQGKRSAEFADLIPGPDFLKRLLEEFDGGAIKLSPAVDFDTLPAGHLELISHNKTVVQAVLWIGALARQFPPDTRTATMFTHHKLITTFTAEPQRWTPPAEDVTGATLLYEVDPAFTRAGLAHALAHTCTLKALTEDGGYLAQEGRQASIDHPALTAFRLTSFLPYSEKNVIAELHTTASAAPPGSVEVKTRGKIPRIDTDRLQVLFSKAVPYRQTVLIFRYGGGIYAAIATRIN